MAVARHQDMKRGSDPIRRRGMVSSGQRPSPFVPVTVLAAAFSVVLVACAREGQEQPRAEGAAPHAEAATPWPSPDYGEPYHSHWRDGRAELAGYALRFPRYGEVREGTAVAIFVAEPFDEATRVKPEGPTEGRFDAFKLNLTQDFPTGIYDYTLMTSAFVQLEEVLGRPPGAITKVSVGAQEWCGHVYHQALFDADAVRSVHHSYFEGEADGSANLPYPTGGFAEDALLLWARGLAGPRMAEGEEVRIPLLRSLLDVRLQHVPLTWDTATLRHAPGTRVIEVPAGRFEVYVRTAEVAREPGKRTYPPGAELDERTSLWTFHVERAFPHRIVRWSRDDGLEGELTGSARLAYWELNAKGGEAHVEALGLPPTAKKPPPNPTQAPHDPEDLSP
jgi:hypothetical protein